MSTTITKDGTEIYYKDLGAGQPIVFSHGWPSSSDDWDAQMLYFGEHGFRCIAHDRRGHGRSTQTWDGNDMDTYADDLMALVEKLDLKNAIHVAHSTGGGEVARYIGRKRQLDCRSSANRRFEISRPLASAQALLAWSALRERRCMPQTPRSAPE
jgi:pimeloyl-ACP methyl ester carboxylesterase